MKQLEKPGQRIPLLTAHDLGPLEPQYLEAAQAMLPPSTDKSELTQIEEQQALGRYLQRGVHLALFNTLANGNAAAEIEKYYDRVSNGVSESTLLSDLVEDFRAAKETVLDTDEQINGGFFLQG